MTDYNKVLRSFIRFQKSAGFNLVSACDGEEDIDNPSASEASDWVCGTEEGSLTFQKEGHFITAYAVLGNEAFCTIADYSWKEDCPKQILQDFDNAHEAFTDRWEDE